MLDGGRAARRLQLEQRVYTFGFARIRRKGTHFHAPPFRRTRFHGKKQPPTQRPLTAFKEHHLHR